MKKVIFATKNMGKLKEVRDIFDGSDIEILSLLDFENIPEIVEDGGTFEENALKKVITIYNHLKIPAIGDDSGLAVEQLNWAPGIFSARYAGHNATDDDNNARLLEKLEVLPQPHKAKFICSAVYYDGNNKICTSGEVNGRIIKNERGNYGFGYDPLFIPDGYNVTMGELEIKEKNRISHRSRAFRKLKILLEKHTETQ